MFQVLETKSIDEINVVRLLLNIHNEAMAIQDPSIRQKIKVFSVSSCVTRLYAILENFIEISISDYLDSLSELVAFSSLPEKFRTEYRYGISYLLSRIEQGRYNHLNHENIVKWYYEATQNFEHYKFVTEALTRHEQNFRLNIIESTLGKIQLKNFSSWIRNHPKIISLYTDTSSIYEQLESEIKQFIQLRNDASHGIMDNLIGVDNLLRLCDLTQGLIFAISSFLRKSLISDKLTAGKINETGIVTEVFKKSGAIVAEFNKDMALNLSDEIIILESNDCYVDLVSSLMINDISVETVVANHDKFEVGIKLKTLVKKNAKLYNLN
jgi:hypothetical protein